MHAHAWNMYVCMYVYVYVFRSTDYGRTFQTQSSKFPSGSELHYTIYRFPNNSRTVSLTF